MAWLGFLFSSPGRNPRPTLISSSISNFFFLSSVQMCWFGIHQLDVLVELDVAGGNFAFLVDREQQGLGFAVVGLEKNLFEVQHDIGDVFDNAVDGRELVHRAVHLDGADGRTFQRREQDPAQRVADRVAVAGFKRLGDELGVGFCGGCFPLWSTAWAFRNVLDVLAYFPFNNCKLITPAGIPAGRRHPYNCFESRLLGSLRFGLVH